AVSTTVQPNVIPQNSFIISSGPTDSSNNQNYILISPIGTAAAAVSSSITAPLVSSPTAAAAAATSRNILLLNDSVAKTSASSDAKELDHHQDLVSSSTAGLQENSLLDSDSNRPTRPSSSDSSLLSGAPPMGRRRYSGLSSRPVTVGESLTSQLNRLEQKRARNRDAARRCRERKIRLIETLEKKVSQLTETNKQLKRELEQTQNEVECLRQFVEQHFKSPAAGGCTVPLKG
uniref:BZIP domain-containing protein n=1 Tax=Mesocestoides corti TaxID=53468 RepID=A0A5K3FGX9_MESCO